MSGLKHPFGEICCEHELEILQKDYKMYFFSEAPFNREALDPSTYLIIGRRGTGKTSLAEYFKFQSVLKNSRCIDVNEPYVYQKVLTEVVSTAALSPELRNYRLVKIWEYLIWSLIFEEYSDKSNTLKAAAHVSDKKGPSKLIQLLLRALLNKFLKDEKGELADELENFISSDLVTSAKAEALACVEKEPVIIAIDTLERHDLEDLPMLQAIASLVQCANNFNIRYAGQGIHVKAFIPAEVFPYISESQIANSTKFIRNPVYLHWRPKDLVRLICWRYYLYLRENDLLFPESKGTINWNKFPEVREKMWAPYFGDRILNYLGLEEKSFPYLLRHTQMRPRQLIILLNRIAKFTQGRDRFPYFDRELIIAGVREAEIEIATEVINSYSRIYPHLPRILEAIRGFNTVFKGNLLDKFAARSAAAWPDGEYSPYKFKRMLSELGIVGQIRNWDNKSNIIEADFEYNLRDRLEVTSDNFYVIHPMFSKKFNIQNEKKVLVYPFPDHPDFNEIH